MHLAVIKKTIIIVPFGLFEYKRMPFGFRNSGQTIQRMMDHILQGLNGVFVYLNDILIVSASEGEHKRHLRALLQPFSSMANVECH
jgi:hypothetical protein